jgi:hypothetical protein
VSNYGIALIGSEEENSAPIAPEPAPQPRESETPQDDKDSPKFPPRKKPDPMRDSGGGSRERPRNPRRK